MESKAVVQSLAALAQDTRLAIFSLLVERGPEGYAAGVIGEKLELANATLSFHLKELQNASLIDSRQEGRFIIYSANYKAMNELLRFLTENCCRASSKACASGCGPLTQPKAQPKAQPKRKRRKS